MQERASIKENIDYCKKNNQYTKNGTPPVVAKVSKFAESIALAEAGNTESIKRNYPVMYLCCKRTLESKYDVEPLMDTCCWTISSKYFMTLT